MRRDLSKLAEREFDVLIIGGGIFGICTAWEAASRGLSVALVERGDFAEAASANCFKLIHGGIRYLQQADLQRLRISSRERNVLLRIAPHQAAPLPVVVPTLGRGMRGRMLLGAGMRLYDLIAGDRNDGIQDPARHIPRGRLIGRRQAIELFPQFAAPDMTGAGILCEAQMHSPVRFALCFLHSATQEGAVAANYTEVVRLIHHKGRVLGAQVVDKLGGDTFEIRGRLTVNAGGGWAPHLHQASFGGDLPSPTQFSRDLCLVLNRSFNESHALAVLTRSTDPDAIVSRSSRHLFLAPWRGRTLLGVWHSIMTEHPDRSTVTESEVQSCLDETNAACPGLRLSLDDVTRVQSGPVLISQSTGKQVRFGTRSQLLDHADQGIDALVTLIGVRYTMARHDAERAVDLLLRKLGREPMPSRTRQTTIFGGAIEDIDRHRREARAATHRGIAVEILDDLAVRYGSEHQRVLAFAEADPGLARCLGDSNVIGAEVAHAVREEMAQTLADVALRRTELATAGAPSRHTLQEAAACAARLLDWDQARVVSEVESVRQSFPAFVRRE